MSTRSQALRAPGRVSSPERTEWRLVVVGFVALVLLLATLVGVAKLNAPSKSHHGTGTVTTRNHTDGGTRVGGSGPYRYHPLP
jgi:hypothetical protein